MSLKWHLLKENSDRRKEVSALTLAVAVATVHEKKISILFKKTTDESLGRNVFVCSGF